MPATITTAIITAAGIAAGTTAATLIGVGVSLVFAVGLTLAQRALFSQDAPEFGSLEPLNEGAKQTIRQAVPKHRIGYGRVTMGGAIIFTDKNPPDLMIQYALLAHECDALESVFTQGVQVFFDVNGNATSTPFFDGVRVFLQQSTRLGTDDQIRDALLFAEFPTISADFRQRGHTVATVRFFYGEIIGAETARDVHERIWGQETNIHPKFRLRAAKIYDPRAPAQLADDPSTWTWTDNAVLVIVDYIRREDGGRKSSDDIDWEFVKGAADICDQQVQRKDGTSEKRYTINGVFDTSQTPVNVLRDMLGAMRGRIVWVNGKFRPMPGAVQTAVMTISQDMLAGPFDYRGFPPRDELINVVRSEFVAPQRSNQVANTPVLERTDLIAIDGQRLDTTLKHPFVEDPARAQRLDKAFLEQSRLGRTLSIITDMRPLRLTAGDVVQIDFKDFPFVNGTYIIGQMDFVSNFSQLRFSLTEFSNDVYAWDPAVDEMDFVLQEAA